MKILIFSFLLCCAYSTAQAQAVYIDSMVAIVEDDVITNSKLSSEVNRIREEYSARGQQLAATASLNRQVLELLIMKSILIQEAKNRGANITETQLNDTMQNLAKRNNKTLQEFRQALLATGIDYNTFREDVKNEMFINTIKNSYARQNVDISDQEVDDFITRNGNDTDTLEYRLSHILIALPDGASSDQVTKARVKAEELIYQLKNGADFSMLAAQNSAGSNAIDGGDLGWRKLAEIPSLFADLMQNIKIGEIGGAIRSPSGFHIVKLVDKRDSDQLIVEQIKARHILIKPNELISNKQAQEKLEKIRDEILQGADFAELAKKHSDDPGSKGLGGELGWINKGTMVPAFEKVLVATKKGETSEVFRSRYGWHILQVEDRKKVDETEESKRNKIKQQLLTQKKREVLELWQKRLRDEAFVKILSDS